MRTSQENAYFKREVRNWSILIQTDYWLQFIRPFSHEFLISFNIDLLKIMKLLFLLLLRVLILPQSAQDRLFISGFTASRAFQLQVLFNVSF